ncbi:Collagen alpha-1(II) chain-like [Melia azedarach]|uniref:Collagen alpha-1(II) chain-like n=1 Tax=Melia azedarach TaxID=155640 RepID=A0ACC1YTP7_MELAZ|nr:Collagen alpha-1(II) chain-like [Melia azedarach]
MMKNFHMLVVLIVVLLFLMSIQGYEGSRVLNKEEATVKKGFPLQSILQRGPVRRPGHNGCTYIPGTNGPPCINSRNFAGHATAPPLVSAVAINRR